MAIYDEIKKAMGDLEEDRLIQLIKEVLDTGGSAEEALKACQEGMDVVGSRFEQSEYFVGDLIYAGDIMTQAVEALKPALASNVGSGKASKMILCTVKGDLHDIGKNIVRSLLEAAGFDVLDLGIDVPPETIVETAKANGIKIVALSGVLTLAIDAMKDTVDAFKNEGMREDVKIIIGGAPVNETVAKLVGSDAWAHSPHETVSICKKWASE